MPANATAVGASFKKQPSVRDFEISFFDHCGVFFYSNDTNNIDAQAAPPLGCLYCLLGE